MSTVLVTVGAMLWSLGAAACFVGYVKLWPTRYVPPIMFVGFVGVVLLGLGWSS